MEHEDYNGWRNRETWALVLHINNDQSLQEWALKLTEQLVEGHGPAAPLIGERIVDGFEELIHEGLLNGSAVEAEQGLMVLRDVGSFWRIDPVEVGESLLEDRFPVRRTR